MITESQKKRLRALGHRLKPVVLIGNAGLSDAVVAEIGRALEAHELIKIKVRVADRDARDTVIASLCEATGATLVQRVGNTALVYRRHPDKPRVLVP